ncbi:hypothetical protein EOD39_18771 [Acipenser ruthenus]|uniref:Uncharacterized protein n=1 Tax=Acipenser ruthenus TaxID=7906 RepID=A0A444UZX6_ACIRT|nr:hypothetical protein EOD39_18771 [Acipenser ruthenus]
MSLLGDMPLLKPVERSSIRRLDAWYSRFGALGVSASAPVQCFGARCIALRRSWCQRFGVWCSALALGARCSVHIPLAPQRTASWRSVLCTRTQCTPFNAWCSALDTQRSVLNALALGARCTHPCRFGTWCSAHGARRLGGRRSVHAPSTHQRLVRGASKLGA